MEWKRKGKSKSFPTNGGEFLYGGEFSFLVIWMAK